MKITTLIPTFRRPHLLKKALRSVLEQTYSDFEVWVCDNASGDETEHITKQFNDPRIHYICQPTNIGMIGNYQFSLSLIKTEFFSFLSDDDLLLPNFFETAINAFQKHPEAGFVAGSTIIMTPERQIVRIPLDDWKKEGKFTSPGELIGKYPVPTSILFHSKILKTICIDAENPLFWDCDYLLQIASHFPYVISKKPCAIFFSHPNSYSNSQDLSSSEASFNRLIERFPHLKEPLEHDLNLSRRSFFIRFLLVKNFNDAFSLAPSLFYKYIVRVCRIFPPFLYLLISLKIWKQFLRSLKYRIFSAKESLFV